MQKPLTMSIPLLPWLDPAYSYQISEEICRKYTIGLHVKVVLASLIIVALVAKRGSCSALECLSKNEGKQLPCATTTTYGEV